MSSKRGNSSPSPRRSRSRAPPSPSPPPPSRSPSRALPPPSPSRSPPPSRKRGNTSQPSSSHSISPNRKRAKPPPPPDFETINNLLGSASTINFISDDSLYSFILHVKIRTPVCVSGVEVSSFCMKITFVNEGRLPVYKYNTMDDVPIEKTPINDEAIVKQFTIQSKLYKSFTLAPFVPRVFAASIFSNKDSITLFDSLLDSRRAVPVFDKKSHYVVSSIVDHVKKHPTLRVDVFLMEYMDNQYATLDTCSFKRDGGYDTEICKTGYQHMAANLACAAGVGFILYDAHNSNGLFNRKANKVVLIDVGDAFDVSDDGDIKKMKDKFNELVSGDKGDLIPHLCKFFSVTVNSKPFSVTVKSELLQAFVANLTCTDFRTKITHMNIHHNLMMVAFVDFMMNYPKIRCRYTMESIYGKSGFTNFNTFLTTFTPILSGDAYHKELTDVAGFITGIINPQPPKKKEHPYPCVISGGKRKKNSKRKNKSKRNIRKTKKYRRIM